MLSSELAHMLLRGEVNKNIDMDYLNHLWEFKMAILSYGRLSESDLKLCWIQHKRGGDLYIISYSGGNYGRLEGGSDPTP